MVTQRITNALHQSSELANKLDDIVARPAGFRIKTESDAMIASQWSINAALHNSILTLFRDNLPAGAFALLRPVVENLFRVHLLVIGEPDIVEKLRSDDFRLSFWRDTQKIDDHFKLGGRFKSLVDQMVKFLHSTAHIGLQQMKRQFNGANLEANYPEHEIVAIINMSTTAKIMIAAQVVERFQTVVELQELLALYKVFTSRLAA
jgi:hypothetical protein